MHFKRLLMFIDFYIKIIHRIAFNIFEKTYLELCNNNYLLHWVLLKAICKLSTKFTM